MDVSAAAPTATTASSETTTGDVQVAASAAGGAAAGGAPVEAPKASGGKKKKGVPISVFGPCMCLTAFFFHQGEQAVTISRQQRNKRKFVTSVSGLELFGNFQPLALVFMNCQGVKLGDAAKAFAKKFSCGCSVTKTADG